MAGWVRFVPKDLPKAFKGSGWPEWVAGDDDPAGFNAAINKRQERISITFVERKYG